MNLTEEQILTLAPDESSKKSGKDLARNGKWVTKAVNEIALWGECQGSGSKPYQTQIDITNIAFKCSCPSRKFPCKHGLGLLLLYANDKSGFIKDAEAPAWVADWLSKRVEKKEKQSEQAAKPVDENAQLKRANARQSKVLDGAAELTSWIRDIVRGGIIQVPEKPESFFENISRRMVDAQAPGLAGMVKGMGETNFYTDKWPNEFLDKLLRTYLVAEGFKNNNSENSTLQTDLRNAIGFTQNQEELKELPGILDTWLVLGKQSYENDNITTEKFWLYGTKTSKYALLMQFIVRGQGLQFSFTPGMFVEAELVYFPGTIPLRALVKRQITTSSVSGFEKLPGWLAVSEYETNYNSLVPFRSEIPFVVEKIQPVQYNQQWWLKDSADNLVQMKNPERYIWNLLTLTGGVATDMAVIGKEEMFEPLGIWIEKEYKII